MQLLHNFSVNMLKPYSLARLLSPGILPEKTHRRKPDAFHDQDKTNKPNLPVTWVHDLLVVLHV